MWQLQSMQCIPIHMCGKIVPIKFIFSKWHLFCSLLQIPSGKRHIFLPSHWHASQMNENFVHYCGTFINQPCRKHASFARQQKILLCLTVHWSCHGKPEKVKSTTIKCPSKCFLGNRKGVFYMHLIEMTLLAVGNGWSPPNHSSGKDQK